MRFFVNGGFKRNGLFRLIMFFTLAFFLLLWLTDVLLYLKVGLSYTSVVDYYRGSAEGFRAPKSYLGLLEEAHFHLFAMAILLLTLNHLLLFTPLPNLLKAATVVLSFSSALCDIASGWLVRFVSPLFAYLKIASFIVLHLTIALLIFSILFFYLKPPPPPVPTQRTSPQGAPPTTPSRQ